MPALSAYLDALKAAADTAAEAEDTFRRDIGARIKALEAERAFAFRRLNLMRAIADAIASARDEATAIAAASSVLRARLGWSDDSEARKEVLLRFAPVAKAMFVSLAPPESEAEPEDTSKALAEFETWYRATHPVAFWVLFENVMPETPLVDF